MTDPNSFQVYVIDALTGVATGTVSTTGFPSFDEPFGVAISFDGSFAFITDVDNGNIYKVNTSTNAVSGLIDKDSFEVDLMMPSVIAISPNQLFGYVSNWSAPISMFKIDIPNSKVISQVQGGGPELIGVNSISISPDNTFGYVTNLFPHIYRLDVASNTLTQIQYTDAGQIFAVDISNDGTFAYFTSNNGLYKINTSNNVISPLPYSFQPCYGLAISPDNKFVCFAEQSNNLIYYVDTATNDLIPKTTSINAPYLMDITPDGQYLIVSDESSNLYQVNLVTNQVTSITNNTSRAFQNTFWVATVPFSSGNISSGNISLVGLIGNSKTLANYLNQYAASSTKTLFSSLTNSALSNALEKADPLRNAFGTFANQINQVALTRLVSGRQTSLRSSDRKLKNDYFRSSRSKSTNVASESLNIEESDLVAANDDLALGFSLGSKQKAINAKNTSSTNANPKINFWMSGFGEYFYENSKHQTPSFNNTSGGFVTACDYKVKDLYPVGAGFAYAHSSLVQDDNFGYATVNQESVFVYGSFDVKDFYFDASIWGGYYQLKNVRKISFTGYSDRASSSTHGWQLTPHLEFGYNYWMNWFNINPFTMADSVNNWESGFSEHGATNLNMGQKGRYCTLLRSETGLRFQEVLTYGWGNVTFLEKASYAYQKTFGTGSINAFLVGSAGSFTVTTLTTAQNLGVGEVEVLFSPKNIKYPYGSFGFHVEAGSMYQSYQAMAEIGWKF